MVAVACVASEALSADAATPPISMASPATFRFVPTIAKARAASSVVPVAGVMELIVGAAMAYCPCGAACCSATLPIVSMAFSPAACARLAWIACWTSLATCSSVLITLGSWMPR
jgi:hypothetical protein